MDNPRHGRGNIDPDEELRLAREAARRTMRRVMRLLPLIVGAGVLLWLASGVYIVPPGGQGVVRQFGQEIAKTPPGLRYHLPWPIQTVDVVDVETIRRLEVGFRTQQGQVVRVPSESLMLTGDENIVDVQLIVQYRVLDPSKFLFRLRNPEQTLHAVTEVAIRSVAGRMLIEDILTVGRAQAEEQARAYVQQLMDEYESGLLITALKLQVVDPPEQVRDAFHEVVRAREDREREQNTARAYREDIVPRARGEAEQIIRAAEAYRAERVFRAQGDVARFNALLLEYRKGRDVTRERLYLETMERVLSGVNKVVIDGAVGDRALPFLPLPSIPGAMAPLPQAPAPAAQPPQLPQPAPRQGR